MLLFHALLTLFMVLVLFFDLKHYIIPNWINLILLLLYPAMVFMNPHPVDWLQGLYAVGVVFGVGFLLFISRLMGGGDIKLLTACAIWCGLTPALYQFVVITAVLGGIMAIALLILRPVLPWIMIKLRINVALPKILTMKQPLPYGIAIALAFLFVLWTGQLPGLKENYMALQAYYKPGAGQL